jgi:hypothetical protein
VYQRPKKPLLLRVVPAVLIPTPQHLRPSLAMMYLRCEDYSPTFLIIRAKGGSIFGAFLTEPWKKRCAFVNEQLGRSDYGKRQQR